MKKTFLLLPALAFSFAILSSCAPNSKTFSAYGDDIFQYVNFNLSYQLEEKGISKSIIITVIPIGKEGYKMNWITCGLSIDAYYYGIKNGEETSNKKTIDFYFFNVSESYEKDETISTTWEEIRNVTLTIKKIYSGKGFGCEAQITKIS